LKTPADVLAETFGLGAVPELAPRYNIAPTQEVAALRRAEGEEEPRLDLLRWGLVPFWAKEPSIGSRMINARGETVASKPAFRAALRRRRCLILADGFYEWKKTGGAKQPFHIRLREDRPFAFAGLWERWEGPECESLRSCAIVTTEPNEMLAEVHDRMPVILPLEDHALWLDPAEQDPARVLPLIRSYPAGEMEAFPVSTWVNSPRNDDPRCVEPLEAS
jgi:putative SOS response-associated peptidase YedK